MQTSKIVIVKQDYNVLKKPGLAALLKKKKSTVLKPNLSCSQSLLDFFWGLRIKVKVICSLLTSRLRMLTCIHVSHFNWLIFSVFHYNTRIYYRHKILMIKRICLAINSLFINDNNCIYLLLTLFTSVNFFNNTWTHFAIAFYCFRPYLSLLSAKEKIFALGALLLASASLGPL